MTVEHLCDLCSNPCEPSAYVCTRCTNDTADHLRGAQLAGEVETTVALLARYAVRGGVKAPEPVAGDPATLPDAHRASQPVSTFAWAASRELPEANALRPTRLPVDLNASLKAAHAFNHVTTWARAVEDDHATDPVPTPQPGQHPVAVAATWLLDQLDWMRHQQFAAEAFDQLKAAGAAIRRIVDRPPDQDVVGVCDCGAYLYAHRGASYVTCPCGLRWDVAESRDNLMQALRDRLTTASEAATLIVIAFPELRRDKVRKLVQSWVRPDRPNPLMAHPTEDGPMYVFGEILDRLSRSGVLSEGHDRANVTA